MVRALIRLLLVITHRSSNAITTYAFYDNGSSGCFITDDLCDKLKALGVPTQLQLCTMHGSSCTDSQVVRDLVVTDINGQASVDLPKVYTRQEIPVTSQQIPRPEMIWKWSHLHHVADQLQTGSGYWNIDRN